MIVMDIIIYSAIFYIFINIVFDKMDNTKCYEYPEHNEKNNFIIEKQYESNPNVDIYRYNRTYMSYLNLYFCIINFKETMFISVTDDNNQMNDLQVSYPIKYVMIKIEDIGKI
ncbi:hypothetical protein PFTANZ_06580 [Plasmodium falciparum Tanzania (2000708)]|uniref:T-box domain-containing protein n=4 Tax=Plasmodium falciparum TaxID=5833 RepID=A0A024VXR0_PLAFA|nr:hypothetical protein PFTANZ_06580 [Plasmodium falciparum Tanzania (2000708)]